MRIVLTPDVKPIKNGYSATANGLAVAGHGRSPEEARRNLERVVSALFRPFARNGTLPEEVAGSGLVIEAENEPELSVRTTTLSPEEAWALYDAHAQALLGMSAEEFERAWARGDFRTRQEETPVRRVVMIRTTRPDHPR